MSLTYDVLKDDVRAGRPIDFGFVTYVPERTCRVECYPPGCEDSLHYEVCSECGTILTASRPGDRHAARASYCPHCGARIVEVSE